MVYVSVEPWTQQCKHIAYEIYKEGMDHVAHVHIFQSALKLNRETNEEDNLILFGYTLRKKNNNNNLIDMMII